MYPQLIVGVVNWVYNVIVFKKNIFQTNSLFSAVHLFLRHTHFSYTPIPATHLFQQYTYSCYTPIPAMHLFLQHAYFCNTYSCYPLISATNLFKTHIYSCYTLISETHLLLQYTYSRNTPSVESPLKHFYWCSVKLCCHISFKVIYILSTSSNLKVEMNFESRAQEKVVRNLVNLFVWFVFYGTSTLMDHLVPNPIYINIYMIYKRIVCR